MGKSVNIHWNFCCFCMLVNVWKLYGCIRQVVRQELESRYKHGRLALKGVRPHDAVTPFIIITQCRSMDVCVRC